MSLLSKSEMLDLLESQLLTLNDRFENVDSVAVQSWMTHLVVFSYEW